MARRFYTCIILPDASHRLHKLKIPQKAIYCLAVFGALSFLVAVSMGFHYVRMAIKASNFEKLEAENTDLKVKTTNLQISATKLSSKINDLETLSKKLTKMVETDPAFYRRIAEAFPDAWLEDPDLDDEDAFRALAPHQDRITWDAPIHSVEDILARKVIPRTVNLKPSRFGSVKSLFEGYEFCEQRGMGAYGGGQYELGVGRGHVQLLAALFHPNAPNDIAPGGYDALDPEPGLPESPLDVDPAPVGFRRAVD